MTKRTLRKKRNNRRERTKRKVTRMKRKSHRKKSNKIDKIDKIERSIRKSIRKSKRKQRGKRRTVRKQKGGAFLPAIGVGAAIATTAAAAYAGFRLINMINDKSYINALLTSPIIDFLPKVKVIETKEWKEKNKGTGE